MAASQIKLAVSDPQRRSYADRDSILSRATPVIAAPNWNVHGASTQRYRPEDLRAAARALGVAEQQLQQEPLIAAEGPAESGRVLVRASSRRTPPARAFGPSRHRVLLSRWSFGAIFCAALGLVGYGGWLRAQDARWAKPWVAKAEPWVAKVQEVLP
jgi:hypothetical protein